MNNKRKNIRHPEGTLTLCVLEPGQKAERVCPDNAKVIEIGDDIEFKLDALDTYHSNNWKPIHHDLLVLCAAIEYADRYRKHGIKKWSRDFNLTIPVFELKIWQRPNVRDSLVKTLKHLTGDEWKFHFVQWQGDAVNRKESKGLPLGDSKKFVIAYSDGIDSRCVANLYDHGDVALRVRVAKNRDRSNADRQPFEQIPFAVKNRGLSESSVRSRGFKFAAITAIAANIAGLKKILVPESGQGALGPVLLPLHNIYPDYRNHPTYFRKMEAFIEALLNHKVTYEQPRLWHTKGQTIAGFLEKVGNSHDNLTSTRSCWQNRWNSKKSKKNRQCGLCAACLLRRMSMHAAGVKESEDTYVFSNLRANSFSDAINDQLQNRKTMLGYGIVGTRHLQQLADMAELSNESLRAHAFEIAEATGIEYEDALTKLKALLKTHAQEWHGFLGAQGKASFLNGWIVGGRFDQSE